MLEMFKGVANSPETTITNDINNTDTLIYVLDETRVPAELPNLMVLGTGVGAETVKVLSIEGNAITVERGFQGVPKVWNAGTIIARNFTEYDYNALVENVKKVDTRVGPLTSLLTTVKTNIVNAINSLKTEVDEHKADNVSQSGGVHGLEIEEGTWTVGIQTSGGTQNHNIISRNANYYRNGNMIFVRGVIIFEKDTNATGTIRLTGLPFVSTVVSAGVINLSGASNLVANIISSNPSETRLIPYRATTSTSSRSEIPISEINLPCRIDFSVNYLM